MCKEEGREDTESEDAIEDLGGNGDGGIGGSDFCLDLEDSDADGVYMELLSEPCVRILAPLLGVL